MLRRDAEMVQEMRAAVWDTTCTAAGTAIGGSHRRHRNTFACRCTPHGIISRSIWQTSCSGLIRDASIGEGLVLTRGSP